MKGFVKVLILLVLMVVAYMIYVQQVPKEEVIIKVKAERSV